MPEKRIDIPVNLTLHIKESSVPYLLELAKNLGLDYGDDPGRKELIRRLFIEGGSDGFEDLNQDPEGILYTRHR